MSKNTASITDPIWDSRNDSEPAPVPEIDLEKLMEQPHCRFQLGSNIAGSISSSLHSLMLPPKTIVLNRITVDRLSAELPFRSSEDSPKIGGYPLIITNRTDLVPANACLVFVD